MNENAVNYTWRQLAKRVGVSLPSVTVTGFDSVGLTVFYGSPEETKLESPGLIVRPCAAESWNELLSASENSLHWLLADQTIPPTGRLPIEEPVPVLFWGEGLEEGNRPFAELWEDGSIVFNADILAASFFMLSRWEEMVIPTRDPHGRFPATASLAYKQKYLDRPVVDEYALIVREWMKLLLPGWKPEVHRFSAKLSHDIDEIRRLRTAKTTLRAIGADLVKRRNPSLAWETFQGSLDPQRDPFYEGVHRLAAISLEHGFTDDAFYFMTGDPGGIDGDYSVGDTQIREVMEFLQKKGFEIGFHPSYHTFGNLALLEEEKSRLNNILGHANFGGRQHFLRFEVPDTWRHWEVAGLKYDSTMGYADHEGFRCGTCHPYHPFDIERNRELDIEELPLIVMDGTLVDYRKLNSEQGYEIILRLARRCKAVAGTFTLLWHNSSLCGRYHPWIHTYEQVVEALSRL